MISLALVPLFYFFGAVEAYLPITFDSENAKHADNLIDLKFVSRIMLPYGPDLFSEPPQTADDHPWAGYGYGMGSGEKMGYDYINHFAYTAGERGNIKVVDYENPLIPQLTEYSFDLTGENNDLKGIMVCSEAGLVLFLLGDLEQVLVYDTVKREAPQRPTRKAIFESGPRPGNFLVNKACNILVVANENPGDGEAEGRITVVRGIDADNPTTDIISLDKSWDDDYLLRKGLHLPFTRNSLKYWDTWSPMADKIDLSSDLDNYHSTLFLKPEYLAWANEEETELLVNMQNNNGLIRVDMELNVTTSVASYGLKDHSYIPVDINSEDKDCDLQSYRNLFALRAPDTIVTVRYNDKTYVVTANEGSSEEYKDLTEEFEASELFDGSVFTLPRFSIDESIFDPTNPTMGDAALFNSACEGISCLGSAEISMGSTAVDYESDPSNPIFYRMVLFGGRGWSIYELPEDPNDLLKLVFDSGDYVERTTCEVFPWAHNAVQDDGYSPAENFPNNTYFKSLDDEDDIEDLLKMNDPDEDGCADQGDGTPGACPLSETVDAESSRKGPQVENIAVGEACGRLIAFVTTEGNSVGLLFDITKVNAPELKKAIHLSPASRYKSPGVAYNDGTIGEHDTEQFEVIPANRSPTGKAALIISGAYSGTLSFWEFECAEEEVLQEKEEDVSSSSSQLSQRCAFGCAVVALLSVWW